MKPSRAGEASVVVPKKKSRRTRSASPIAPVLLLLIAAAAAGWFFFRPVQHHIRPTAQVTEPPAVAEATAIPAPAQTIEPTPSAAPSETPGAPSPPASPRAANPNAPRLALIIDDCGQWIATERGFVALPVPLTLSVLPDVHYTATIAQEAQAAGKGVMLHLPMETLSGMDPGPGKVTTSMSDAQIEAQVEADLAQVPLAKGVNNHEGSKASADPRVMRDVLGAIAKHGELFFIDSRTNSKSVGESVAAAAGVPTAGRDVFLDNKADVAYSEAQLREAATIAKRSGSAIVIGHPRPTTLEAVRALIPELQAQGIDFVLAQSLTR